MATALTVYDGALVRFSAVFIDETTGLEADPTQVAFVFGADGGTETTWIYGTNAELVKDETGMYHADVDTFGMAPTGDKAYLTGEFFGDANNAGTLQVNDAAKVLVLANPMTNPFDS